MLGQACNILSDSDVYTSTKTRGTRDTAQVLAMFFDMYTFLSAPIHLRSCKRSHFTAAAFSYNSKRRSDGSVPAFAPLISSGFDRTKDLHYVADRQQQFSSAWFHLHFCWQNGFKFVNKKPTKNL